MVNAPDVIVMWGMMTTACIFRAPEAFFISLSDADLSTPNILYGSFMLSKIIVYLLSYMLGIMKQ